MTLLILFDDDDIIPDGHKKEYADEYKEKFKAVASKAVTAIQKPFKKKKKKPQIIPKSKYEQKVDEFKFYESQFFYTVTALGLIDELEAAKDALLEAELRNLEDRRETLWVEMLRVRAELEDELLIILAVSI